MGEKQIEKYKYRRNCKYKTKPCLDKPDAKLRNNQNLDIFDSDGDRGIKEDDGNDAGSVNHVNDKDYVHDTGIDDTDIV